MKRMKKFLALALVGVLAVSAVGCGATGEASGSTDEGSTEKVEIEYWHINSETFAGPTVTEIVDAFNASQDEIHVTEKFAGDYLGIMQDLQADAAAGTTPDVVQIGWSFKEYFGNNFGYTDVNELFADTETPDFVTETFEDSVKELAVHSNGDMVGVPYGMSVPVLYMNTEILSEAGVDIADIKTWPDVEVAARQVAESTDKYGLYIGEYTYVWEMQQMIESNGGQYITDGLCSIDSPGAVEAMELYAGLVKDGTALHVVSEEGTQAYLAGEVGIYMDSVAYTELVQSSTDYSEIMVAPGWEGQDLKLPIGGNFLAITSSTDEKKAATAEFIAWMLDAENMLAWDGATGYIPPIKSAVGSDYMEENPVTQMAYDQLGAAVPWAAFPGNNGLEAEQILIAMRGEILSGDTSVADALTKAQEDINQLYQ